MIVIIAKNEIISAIRNHTALLLTAIFYLLATVAIVGGWKNLSHGSTQRQQAKEMFRKEWTEQEAHPHSAAHFGTYLFKPLTFIALFDTGLNNYTGNSYRVEAHKQAEMNYAAAQDADTELRFGELTIASLFQLFLPLLIIFLCFRSVSAEREHQTLKLLYAQGLRSSTLLWGKILGNYALILIIIFPVLLAMLASTALREPDLLGRLNYFLIFYLIYFLIVTITFVGISALTKHPKNSLLVSLGVWVAFFILMPKLSTGIASTNYPLPSRGEFNKMVEEANLKGLHGDKDRSQRTKEFLKQTLSKFKVDSVAQLPINFDGLRMQYGEEYLSKVYRRFNADVEKNIQKQRSASQLFAFFNPFLSIQQLSMAMAGSDYQHHIDFHKKAQAYRDEFIRQLNIKMAYGDKSDGKYEYKVGPEFFRSMNDFQYLQPNTSWALTKNRYPIIALLLWLCAAVISIYPISKKIANNL